MASAACRASRFPRGDIHEGQHHSGDTIIHGAVGQQSHQEPFSGIADFMLDRAEFSDDPRGVGFEIGVVDAPLEVGERPADIRRDEIEDIHRARGIARDMKLAIEEDGGDRRRVHQVVQVAVGVGEFVHFAL